MKPNVHIVLVRPIYASNVGFCARVSANMGIQNIHIIEPEYDKENEDANKRAANAQQQLSDIHFYPKWEEFYTKHPNGLRVAFTRRAGKNRQIEEWSETLQHITNELPQETWQKDIYMFFGPEDHGLSADDLQFVHLHTQLPVYGDNGSYNLAHAVLLASYIIQNYFKKDLQLTQIKEENIYTEKPLVYSDEPLKAWLETLGMTNFPSPKSAANVMSKMILRATPSNKELEIWNKIVFSTIRLLKNLRPEDRWQTRSSDKEDK